MTRMIPAAVVLVFLIALLLTAGCAQQATVSVIPSGGLSGSVAKVEDHWNTGLGCYWKAFGSVFTTGGDAARDVTVNLQLIDTRSGNIRDTRTLELGDLAAGDSRSFEIALDGECDRTYRVEVRPVARG
ncbi:MAG: hypothetical protein LUO87_00495 [Methanomicrobiales archaeon]|nr:hypothetical protein [Methanomicrobiales archaeon]MDD1658626.1 hypothetical protein [Methanomicrobiales archaeon]